MVTEFRAGQVLNDSLRILGRNFVPLMILTVICTSPVLVVNAMDLAQPDIVVPGERTARSPLEAVSRLLGLICTPLLTGALTFAVFQAIRGKNIAVGEALSAGFRRIVPLLGVAICSGLFVFVGFLLLIIPGIIFMCMVYVASPVCVVEQEGVFASMRRSRELTKGYRSTIFGIVVLMFLLTVAIGAGVGFLAFGISSVAFTFIAVSALQLVATAWAATAAVVAYYHLRSIKESIDVDEIARVFE